MEGDVRVLPLISVDEIDASIALRVNQLACTAAHSDLHACTYLSLPRPPLVYGSDRDPSHEPTRTLLSSPGEQRTSTHATGLVAGVVCVRETIRARRTRPAGYILAVANTGSSREAYISNSNIIPKYNAALHLFLHGSQ